MLVSCREDGEDNEDGKDDPAKPGEGHHCSENAADGKFRAKEEVGPLVLLVLDEQRAGGNNADRERRITKRKVGGTVVRDGQTGRNMCLTRW